MPTSVNEAPFSRVAAAKLLGVPPETAPAEARAVFLRRLDSANFVPSEHWCAGAALLGEVSRVGGFGCAALVSDQACQDALIAGVDRFREDFWQLRPTERAERLNSLRDLCRDDLVLTKQLQFLSSAVDLETAEFIAVDGKAREIASLIKQTFVMRPLDAAARQLEWLAQVSQLPSVWKRAMTTLHETAPRVAAINPDLLERIQIQISRDVANKPSPANRKGSQGVNKSKPANTNSAAWMIYLGIFVAVGIGRGLTGSSSSESNRVTPPRTAYPRYDDRETKPLTNHEINEVLATIDPALKIRTSKAIESELIEELRRKGTDQKKIMEIINSYTNPKGSTGEKKDRQKQEIGPPRPGASP